jgi:hypothetical protein
VTFVLSPGIDAARALLRWQIICVSVVWIPALTFVLSALLSYLAAGLAMFREKGLRSNSWVEHTQAEYSVRRAMQLTLDFALVFMIILNK